MPPTTFVGVTYASDSYLLRGPLGAVHLLPDLLPAPLQRTLDVHNEPPMGTLFPSDDVRVSGQLLPEPT